MNKAGNITIFEAVDDFKRVHKSIIFNIDEIDCETLGIYTRIMSFGKKWNLNIKGLAQHLKLSDARVRKAIAKLESIGLLARKAVKDEHGKFIGWDYNIYATPLPKEKRTSAGKRSNQTTDYPKNGQDRKPTCPKTDLSENGGEINNKLKENINLKNTIYLNNSWKENFDEYLKLVNEAKQAILNDKDFILKIEQIYVNIDFARTLEANILAFWGTELGWQHKKKAKGKEINMLSTLKKSISSGMNKVFKSKYPPMETKQENKPIKLKITNDD